jgi:hypothetical protein
VPYNRKENPTAPKSNSKRASIQKKPQRQQSQFSGFCPNSNHGIIYNGPEICLYPLVRGYVPVFTLPTLK